MKRQYFVLFLMAAVGLKLCLFTKLIGFTADFQAMWVGYLFSFLFSILIFFPLFFVKKAKKPIALAIALIVAVILFLDLVYFRFFQSLPTFGLMDAIRQTGDVAPSVAALVKWSDLLLFLDVFILILFEFILAPYLKISWKGRYKEENIGKMEKVLLVGLVFGLIALFLTFSFLAKPKQRLSDALSWSFETRYNTQYFGVMGSHLIDGYRFFEEKFTTISPEEKKTVLDWVNTNLRKEPKPDPLTGVAKGKRVIIVQVESLGEFVIGKKYQGQEITPNLNKLKTGSYYFSDDRFVIGSGHTSDTDLVVNSSIYPLYDSAAFVRYGKDGFLGLAKTLSENGYTTDAYHAYNRNYWNRSVALGSLGYQKFLAAESFPKGKTINMDGLNDRDFLTKTAEYIRGNPGKSLNYAITLSSHYPFAITDETKGLNLDPDQLPAFVGGYLQDINYTDRAIGNFFDQLKKDGLYDDSVIVVYGDHYPTMNDFKAGDLSYKMDSLENKRVPLFIKIPGQTTGSVSTQTVTHLDIMPTILDLLGVKTNAPMFGQSLFLNQKDALPRCTDGEVIHVGGTANCTTEIVAEKNMAAKIIKYNLFSDLAR